MKKNVDSKTDKGFGSDTDSGKLGDIDTSVQTEPSNVRLTPFWFRLLLKIPKLPSIIWMPATVGLLCYVFLPVFTIFGYILALLFVLRLSFPWNWLCLAGIISPLTIVLLSVKAHAFWNNWSRLFKENGTHRSLDEILEEYVTLVRGKRNS